MEDQNQAKNNNTIFETSDLHLAAALLTIGYKFINLKIQGAKGIFVFKNDEQI